MNPEDPNSAWRAPAPAQPQAPYQPLPEEPVAAPVDPLQPPETLPDDQVEPYRLTVEQESYDQEPGSEPESSETPESDEALLQWQAMEYIQREHPLGWYVILAIVTLALMAIAYFSMRSWTFAILIPVMAAALIMYTKRPPAVINYTLTRKGLYINDTLHPYAEFKSFSILSQGGHNSAVLVPRKRFNLGHTVYFPQEVGEALVDMLAERLPMKETKPDLYDRIIAKLRI